MAKGTLTAARLREQLHYDPKTGEFKWMVNHTARSTTGLGRGRRAIPGTIKDCGNGVYKSVWIRLDGGIFRRSRLAWLWMTGAWPKNEVDHINRDPLDDRWCNLRDVTRKENAANKKHKRISWCTRDRRWVVHYSFEKRADAEAIVRLIELQLHKDFGSSAGKRRTRQTAARR